MKKKQIKKTESGRSMVEMLGVLAIMGVLSIGGVAGYGRAITMYRTNSAIETSQRQAAIVAGDVGFGQAVSPGSAAIIKAPSGYEVAVKDVSGGATDITTTTPFFGVEVGGNNGGNANPVALQREVAEQMFERAVGEWKNVHAFGVKSGDSVTWLKSSDNFNDVVGADAKTVIIIVVYASDLSLRSGDLLTEGLDVTPEGDDGTTCPEGTDTSYEGGHATTLNDGTRCYCETGTVWDEENETCTEKPNECRSYRDCDRGEFCKLKGNASGCNVTEAVCEPLDDGTEHTYVNGNVSKTFLVSDGVMFRWAAKDWCIAHGKQLATYSTLQTLFNCNKSTRSCDWNKFKTDSYWVGGKLSGSNYWSGEIYETCGQWYFTVGYGASDLFFYSYGGAGYNYVNALCEQAVYYNKQSPVKWPGILFVVCYIWRILFALQDGWRRFNFLE